MGGSQRADAIAGTAGIKARRRPQQALESSLGMRPVAFTPGPAVQSHAVDRALTDEANDALRDTVDPFTRGALGRLQRPQPFGAIALLVQQGDLERQRGSRLCLRDERRSLRLPLIEPAEFGAGGVPARCRGRRLSRNVGQPSTKYVVLFLQTSPGVERGPRSFRS